jgi:5-aminopentanamidase
MKNAITIAACQLPDVHDDIKQSVNIIIEYATKAEAQGARLVCFPECYLQGYVVGKERTSLLALDLASVMFQNILQSLAKIQPILVFGMIETKEQKLYNTAVVVKQGQVLGHYRKTKLLPGESIFGAGKDYPVFTIDNFRFGINICYDLNFPECAAAVAKQNAHLLVCPSNNMMDYDTAERWKHKHNESRAQRATESGLWLLSSDVTGERDGRISYGPTALISSRGDVVAQAPLLQEGMIVEEIIYDA